MLSIGSLFSGIGGLELGLEWAGLGPVLWQCEIDEYCRNILARHWPDTPRYADVRLLRGAQLERPDLLCGGFPCQDVSSAGTRAGLTGRRSGLWREFARVVGEVRPTWVVIENVASGARLWVDAVRADLERLGYESLPVPLSASDVGAPHRRSRVFIVAHAHAEGEHALPVYAEVAGPPAPAPNSDGAALRVESGRQRGALRAGPLRPRTPASDPHCVGRIESHDAPAAQLQRWARTRASALRSPGWSSESGLVPVVHGVSGSVDCRIRAAFGNSVVPQCAEVVGWVVRELAGLTRA